MTTFSTISESTFPEVLSSVQPVLVEFGAPWCVPCRNLEPILEQLGSGALAGKLKLTKANVDECPGLVNRFSIMTVPTLILFINGRPVEKMTGLQTAEKILQKFEPHLPTSARQV